ncbi:hypothetical protein [Streptomyces decoyicus]
MGRLRWPVRAGEGSVEVLHAARSSRPGGIHRPARPQPGAEHWRRGVEAAVIYAREPGNLRPLHRGAWVRGGAGRQAVVVLVHVVTAPRTSWRIMRTPATTTRVPAPQCDPDWIAHRTQADEEGAA